MAYELPDINTTEFYDYSKKGEMTDDKRKKKLTQKGPFTMNLENTVHTK